MSTKPKTGWISRVYNEERHHRTLKAADKRAQRANLPDDGVWCAITGSRVDDCQCEQCQEALTIRPSNED